MSVDRELRIHLNAEIDRSVSEHTRDDGEHQSFLWRVKWCPSEGREWPGERM